MCDYCGSIFQDSKPIRKGCGDSNDLVGYWEGLRKDMKKHSFTYATCVNENKCNADATSSSNGSSRLYSLSCIQVIGLVAIAWALLKQKVL